MIKYATRILRTGMSLAAMLVFAACAGKESETIEPLQRKDKQLSCREVKLEINEAEFYLRAAEGNKNPDLETFLMPLGYMSTYMSAQEASKAAKARVEYLNRVYDILRCDERSIAPAPAAPRYYAPAPVAPAPAAPVPQYDDPVGESPYW